MAESNEIQSGDTVQQDVVLDEQKLDEQKYAEKPFATAKLEVTSDDQVTKINLKFLPNLIYQLTEPSVFFCPSGYVLMPGAKFRLIIKRQPR